MTQLPIPMVLFCPACGLQHVDAPDPESGWENPPHRTHLCHGCGHHFRPADVPTIGVFTIETRGAFERDQVRGRSLVAEDLDRLRGMLEIPEIQDFVLGVNLEAAHQRQRWGVDHDAGKDPADWLWLLGHLAGKALHAVIAGNLDKAKHHFISSAAVLANWHAHVLGVETRMRPGIAPPEGESAS